MDHERLIRVIAWLGIGLILASPVAAFWSFWASVLMLLAGMVTIIFADENWPFDR
jgi:hypothetical protein